MSKRKNNKNNNQKILITIIGIILILVGSYFRIVDVSTEEDRKNENPINQKQNVSGNLEVYFIDVGQADSILVRNNNESMLIDAGNNDDGDDVVSFIKGKGITKLNYLVGTHPHEDHIGGLDTVINSDIDIENILMPKIQTNTKTFEDVLDAIKNKNKAVKAPKKGEKFKIGNSNCEVMTDSIIDEKNINISSIVIRLEYGSNSFLFMGDSEKDNEKTISWPKTDVLKVGHHGSNTSSSEEFLKQVNPKYSVIMAGKNNSYGLPKDKILKRLENTGTKILRTDEIGTIQMISDGDNIEVN